jgi:hypothetical protein
VVLGAGDMTELLPPDGLVLDGADPEDSGLVVGFGCCDGCGAEAVADGTLDAEAEAGRAGDVGGVGPVHTVDADVKEL